MRGGRGGEEEVGEDERWKRGWELGEEEVGEDERWERKK